MKNLLLGLLTVFSIAINAQESANRFFYELTYAPNKDSLQKKVKTKMFLISTAL